MNQPPTQPEEPTTPQAQALEAVTAAGILSAELYHELSPFTARPNQQIGMVQIAAYLALAEQMHRRSAEAIAALVELQAATFTQHQ